MRWILVIVRLTSEPSRHRVAVWRELRRAGAVPVAQAVWVVPSTPAFLAAVERATELAHRGDGDVLVLEVSARDAEGESTMRDLFAAVRGQEWAEFVDDCAKFEVEIAKEIRIEKFTLAELEEEEQSLERLRRWYRDLKARDVLNLPAAVESEARLKGCVAALEGYADLVFRTLHGNPVSEGADPLRDVGDE